MKSPRGIFTTAFVICAAALSACSASVSFGGSTIDASELETEVASQLHEQFPDLPEPTISCPDSLKAEVDEVTHCTLSTDDSEDEYDVRVTVTKIDEDKEKASFDIQVADEPNE